MLISFNTLSSTSLRQKYLFGLMAMSVLATGLILSFVQPGVIDTDGGIFGSVAFKDLRGGTLYVDAWENKPPGIFYLMEFFMFLIPDPVYALFALAFLGLIGLGLLSYTYIFNSVQSLSVSLVLGCLSVAIEIFKPNCSDGLYTEIFGTLCIIAAMVCKQQYDIKPKSYKIILAYSLLGTAFWFKEPFILMSMAGFIYFVVNDKSKFSLTKSILFFCIPGLLFILALYFSGSLNEFIKMVLYNFNYSKAEQVVSYKVKLNDLYYKFLGDIFPVLVIVLFWTYKAFALLEKKKEVLASLLMLVSSLSFLFLSPYNFGHYYIPFFAFIILYVSDAYKWNSDMAASNKIPLILLGLYSIMRFQDQYSPKLNFTVNSYKPDRIIEILRADKNKTLFVDYVNKADIYLKAGKVPMTFVPVALPVHFQSDSAGLANRKRIYTEIEQFKPDYVVTTFTTSYFSWFMPNSPYYENNYNKVDSVKPNDESLLILWKRKVDKY